MLSLNLLFENKYYSSSQAGADLQAQNANDASGQLYADPNSTCVKAYYNDDKCGTYYFKVVATSLLHHYM